MEWYTTGLLLIVLVGVLLAIGLPIAVALGLTTFLFIIPVLGLEKSLMVVGMEFINFWMRPTFIILGLFILIAELLKVTGAAADIFEVAAKWLRRLPGGLALVTIGTNAIFATMSGSHTAAVAALTGICYPEMKKRGYSDRLATGSIAAAGGLAHLIPPSVLAVIYAGLAEISLGEQLIAGVFPGFLLASLYAAVAMVWALRNPSAAPREDPVSWKERFWVLRKTGVPIALVFSLLVTIYTGIATVTEAASLGAFVALIYTLGRRVGWKLFNEALASTLRVIGFVMLLIVGAKLLSWVMSYNLIAYNLVRVTLELGWPPMAMMVLFMLMYIVMGMFINSIGMIVITIPVLLPVVLALGFDPLWFGVLILINFEVATVTPPYGLHLYIIKGAAPDVSLKDIILGAFVFVIADFTCMGLVMGFPQIALWLPHSMRG